MLANRKSQSALLKSKVDQLDYRLREMEAAAAEAHRKLHGLEDMRRVLDGLKELREEGPALSPTFLAPLTPLDPIARSPSLPQLGRCRLLKKQIVPEPKVVKIKKVIRATKFTAEVLAQIPAWIEQGLTREEMAERIGTTPNCLQVTCSRKGISLWKKGRNRVKQVIFVREEEAA